LHPGQSHLGDNWRRQVASHSTCANIKLRGGGIETSFKGDKQGLFLTKRNKKRGSRTTHAGVAWLFGSQRGGLARRWMTSPHIQRCGILHMVRDVFHGSQLALL
jgi:hypothetical protein